MGTTGEKSGIFLKNPGPVAAGTWWIGSQAWSQFMKPGTSWAVETSCSVWQVVFLLENRRIRHSFSDLSFSFQYQVCSQKHISFSSAEVLKIKLHFLLTVIFFLIRVFLIPTPQNGIQPQFPYSPHPTLYHPSPSHHLKRK